MAPLRAMRAAAPAMAERGWGRIVNVCSTAGKRPSAAMPEYSVAKAAELSLSRLFADRYAKSGVLVNAICPGPAESEMWMEPGGLLDQSQQMSGAASREEALADAGAKRPIGRLAELGRDRRRDRLPLLRARLLRQRRRLVGRRRHGPGDHLRRLQSAPGGVLSRLRAKHATLLASVPGLIFAASRDDHRSGGAAASLRLAGRRARADLHRAPRRPAAPRRRDLVSRRPPGSGSTPTSAPTALREAQEEIALDPARGRARRGAAGDHHLRHQLPVHPFVGLIPHPQQLDLQPNPAEVETVLTFSLELLRESYEMRRLVRRGVPIHTPTYEVEGQLIWGATARILGDLLERLG